MTEADAVAFVYSVTGFLKVKKNSGANICKAGRKRQKGERMLPLKSFYNAVSPDSAVLILIACSTG